MGTDIRIRPASCADTLRIAAMVERYWAFEGISGYDQQTVTGVLQAVIGDHRIGNVFVAGDGESLFGYLITVYVFSLEHLGITAEIDEFYVELQWRSRGVGSLLLAEAERSAANAGCTNLSLQLSERNEGAREFYLRHSFLPRPGYALFEKQPGGKK